MAITAALEQKYGGSATLFVRVFPSLSPSASAFQELEAALVQSQRERDGARAQLHELQLSLRTEGEFGRAGKRLR